MGESRLVYHSGLPQFMDAVNEHTPPYVFLYEVRQRSRVIFSFAGARTKDSAIVHNIDVPEQMSPEVLDTILSAEPTPAIRGGKVGFSDKNDVIHVCHPDAWWEIVMSDPRPNYFWFAQFEGDKYAVAARGRDLFLTQMNAPLPHDVIARMLYAHELHR